LYFLEEALMKSQLIRRLAKTSTVIGLVAGSTLAASTIPAHAYSFGNNSISFDTDTTVDFNFVTSQGYFQSILGVVMNSAPDTIVGTLFQEVQRSDNGGSNDWMGTCPTTVPNCNASFTFLGGQQYSLILQSENGNVYSTNALNAPTTQQAIFSSGNPFASPVTIGFDDRGGGNDRDFNDFSITAQARNIAATPEPGTVAALIGAGTLGVMRRRRKGATN
jgi:hypothetical protein